ncbi:MAG TPA: hypothetical protein DDW73_14825 [Rhizobium sp.]|jgi:hypothetical protein|nr:hypothetical protein [Rhizobium sp.]
MQWYHLAIGACAIFAYASSGNLPCARRWCLLISGGYVLSVVYAHAAQSVSFWTPRPVAIAFMCDAIVFKIIDETHNGRWEEWGPRLFMAVSASVNFLQLTALIFNMPAPLQPWIHSALLEVITAIALVWIGGYGISKRLADAQHFGPDLLGDCCRHLAALAVPICKAGSKDTKVCQPLRKR